MLPPASGPNSSHRAHHTSSNAPGSSSTQRTGSKRLRSADQGIGAPDPKAQKALAWHSAIHGPKKEGSANHKSLASRGIIIGAKGNSPEQTELIRRSEKIVNDPTSSPQNLEEAHRNINMAKNMSLRLQLMQHPNVTTDLVRKNYAAITTNPASTHDQKLLATHVFLGNQGIPVRDRITILTSLCKSSAVDTWKIPDFFKTSPSRDLLPLYSAIEQDKSIPSAFKKDINNAFLANPNNNRDIRSAIDNPTYY